MEVVDLRSLRPLDRQTVCASVRKTTRAVVLEDDWLSYGIGAEIAATIAEGPSTASTRPSAASRRPRSPCRTPSSWKPPLCPTRQP